MKKEVMILAVGLACAMLLAATGVQGSTIQAFSGNTCDGNAGAVVQCDGSCYSFQNRHSFTVSVGGSDHCVLMFVNTRCLADQQSLQYGFLNQDGGCQNVNTGTSIQSFICSPNNYCEV